MIARLLFIAIPLALLALGVKWVRGAVDFWIATSGRPNTLNVVAFTSPAGDFEVKVFYPEVIKSTDTDLKVEIEIKNNQQVAFTDTLNVSVTDDCDYISLDKTLHTFDLISAGIQPRAESLISTRNTAAPSSCDFEVKVFDQNQEYGNVPFSMYINSWLGHVVSVVSILGGSILSLASFRTALAALGIF